MVVWSSIFRAGLQTSRIVALRKPVQVRTIVANVGALQFRQMSGHHGPRLMALTPSRHSWHVFKDQLHFFVLLGVIPVLILVFCVNVFVGPAQLEPIPEGYHPEPWEYYQHPITRFIARYFFGPPQQEYEKKLHVMYKECEKMELRKLENKIKALMAERKDYKAYYYRPISSKYIKATREANEVLEETWGNN